MSMESTANVARETIVAASSSAGAAGFVLLGIPQGMLIAAFVASLLGLYFSERKSEGLYRTIFGIIAVAFTSAWAALILQSWSTTLAAVAGEAVAGFIAITFHTGRVIAKTAAERWVAKKLEQLP